MIEITLTGSTLVSDFSSSNDIWWQCDIRRWFLTVFLFEMLPQLNKKLIAGLGPGGFPNHQLNRYLDVDREYDSDPISSVTLHSFCLI